MDVNKGIATPLLVAAGFALVLSLLIRGALEISTNPVAGEASYDVSSWIADLMQLLSVGLLSAWAGVRTLTRARPGAAPASSPPLR